MSAGFFGVAFWMGAEAAWNFGFLGEVAVFAVAIGRSFWVRVLCVTADRKIPQVLFLALLANCPIGLIKKIQRKYWAVFV